MAANPKSKMQTSERLIRLRDVIEKTGLSKTTIYRLSGDTDSDFPASVRLTPAAVGWRESEIDVWINSRGAAA